MTERALSDHKNTVSCQKPTYEMSLLMHPNVRQALSFTKWIKDRRTSRPRMTPLQKTGCAAYCRNSEQRG